MRTRFLVVDYFNRASSEALENLNFLSLPVPQITCWNICNDEEIDCFNSVLSISLEIEGLPVENALSTFLSDVVPHNIDVGSEDLSVIWSRYGTADTDGRKNAEERRNSIPESLDIQSPENGAEYKQLENWKTFRSEALEVNFPKTANVPTIEQDEDRFHTLQFEISELDSLLEHVCSSEDEERKVLSEVPEIETPRDMLQLGVSTQHPYEVTKSVYSVDVMNLEYHMDRRCSFVEDAGSVEDKTLLYPSGFPLMELNEIISEYHSSSSMEDELYLLLQNIGCQSWTQDDNLMVDHNELLGSLHIDIIDYFMKHYPFKQWLESRPLCLSSVLEMDFISLEDATYISSDPGIHLETSDIGSISVISLFNFQEVQVLDFDDSQCLEVFDSYQTLTEPETFDQMFGEDISSTGNSYESIVSQELTLVDDSFKSMPIPVISDDDKVESLHTILEEILAELKTCPPSASDGIYLDWNLLEDRRYNHDICSTCRNMLESIDTYDIDSMLESVNDGKGMIDIVFYDDNPDDPNISESKEIMDELTDAILMFNQPLIQTSMGHLPVDDGQKNGSGESLSEVKPKNISMIFDSMSQFSDLDFFLNPWEPTTRRNCKRAFGEASDTKAKLPVISEGNSASTCASAELKPQKWDVEKGVSQSMSTLHEGTKRQMRMELLNFIPVEDKSIGMGSSEAVDKVEACCEHIQAPVLCPLESEQVQSSNASFPDIIIIVNTQNFDKEMIISQRSTYQKILALEKRGAQVVEREINMPVDLIFSAAICLAWYDCRNIGKKATDTDEACSCLSLCVENIATNILTLLSFSFSICILVFEGDSSFLAAIMESSDELYAAASSLGIDLQLFCSYSSALTDEIILSCIEYATKLTTTHYPKMHESESLAESFLTRFPSINPLSAHAILSSGGTLVDFLEWTYDHRIQAVGKYCVPDESIALFSALCRYGEQEESKSGMTECSSVSPVPDSKNGHCRLESERKKRKSVVSPHKFDINMDDYLHDRSEDGGLKPYTVCDPQKSNVSEIPNVLERIEKSISCPSDKFFVQKLDSEIHRLKNLDWDTINNSENVHDKFRGEVIDLDNCSLFSEDFSTFPNNINFTKAVPKKGNYSIPGSTTTTKRLSFDTRNHTSFPIAAEIESESDIWNSLKDHSQMFEVGALATDSNKGALPLDRQEFLEEGPMCRSSRNTQGMSFQEKHIPSYGGTPLPGLTASLKLQQGSPWTIEFLNKIKAKSKMHKQSLQHEIAAISSGCPGNIEKTTKRKSPSTLDFFRYQGSRIPKKITRQKLQNQSMHLSSSSKVPKTSSSVLPTWTPIDKRARQTLSFARRGNESQRKLVWSDGNVHGPRKRLCNQT